MAWVLAPGPLLLTTHSMEKKSSPLELLLDGTAQYSKINFELVKLKFIDQSSSVVSTLISRTFFAMAVALFSAMLTIAISFWLGELLGKIYYGFLVVAAFYGVVGVVLLIFHPAIKKRVAEFIILKMLN
jgi:hypothetical protein